MGVNWREGRRRRGRRKWVQVDSIGGEGIVEGVEVTNKIYIVAGKQWQGEGEQKRSHGRSKARAGARRESKNKITREKGPGRMGLVPAKQ
jgi:hypothetical protein